MSGAEELAGVAEALPDALLEYVEDDGQGDVVADKPDDQSSAEVEVDPLVAKAQKDGWTDKDAWVEAGKDPDQWVDAKEFISRKPLYDRNRELKRELKAERERTEKVAKFASKAAETARKQVLAELESERLKAVEIGDTEGFLEAEKRIKEAEKEYPVAPEQDEEPPEAQIPAPVKDFADRNAKWFEKDKPMTIFMVESTKEYTAAGKPLDEAIKLAEADVKREFAHKFLNPNKDKPSAVGSSNKEERPNTVTHAQLSAEQRQIWSAIKKTGMTFDEFVTDLKAQGEFK
jgi:hypothetical protein